MVITLAVTLIKVQSACQDSISTELNDDKISALTNRNIDDVEITGEGGIKEVILALSTTMEGDTTNFYIYRKLEKLGVKLSVIARGISVGDELEYADEVTLGRSIVNRTVFTGTM